MILEDKTLKEFGYTFESLPKTSIKKVWVKCDYCGEESKKDKATINQGRKYLQKESCKKCRFEKSKETNLIKYGVDNPLKLKDFQEKARQTYKDKTGFDNPFSKKDIQDKIRQTNIKSGKWKVYNGKTMDQWSEEIGKAYSTFQAQVLKYGFDLAIKINKSESALETKLVDWLKLENISFKQQIKFGKKEADFLIDDKFIIELNGDYYHTDFYLKDKKHHYLRKKMFNDAGYSSLFFMEYEVNQKFDIIKSIILNRLKKSNRIYARKCNIVELSYKDAKQFFNQNHLMGPSVGKCFALELNDIQCAIQIRQDKDIIKIQRFACKLNTSVIGGFSRLIKYIEKILNPKQIINFVDRRYGSGKFLEKLGFKLETYSLSFKWSDGHKVVHRMKFPSSSGYDKGFFKIWDCGQAKYIKEFK